MSELKEKISRLEEECRHLRLKEKHLMQKAHQACYIHTVTCLHVCYERVFLNVTWLVMLPKNCVVLVRQHLLSSQDNDTRVDYVAILHSCIFHCK